MVVQEMVIASPSPVTGDTALLVPVGCGVLLEGFGQEQLQPVWKPVCSYWKERSTW